MALSHLRMREHFLQYIQAEFFVTRRAVRIDERNVGAFTRVADNVILNLELVSASNFD